MPLKNYGVLVGRPISHRVGQGAKPHFQIRIVDNDTHYRIAVNIKSQQSPSELAYLLDDDFQHPITARLAQLAPGFHVVESKPDGLALDYIRGNLFNPQQMRLLPPDAPGPDNDLNDELNRFIQRAMADEDATLYAFGERWGPEPVADKYFGFKPGNGIHDIHKNQGNSAQFKKDDGVWQDGGLMLRFPRPRPDEPVSAANRERWIAVFLKFQSQSWHTDDKTGHTISTGTPGPVTPPPTPVDSTTPPTSPAPLPATDDTIRIIAALVNPVGPGPEAETVTLLNTTPNALALDGWALADRFKNKHPLTGTLAAGATLLVKLLPPIQLSNQGGIITLLDANGLKVHGVSYTAAQARREGFTIVF